MKRTIAITTAVLLLTAIVSITSAHAGAARRHTIEGFMIGTGVAILGAAIINELNKDTGTVEAHAYSRHPRTVYEKPYYHGPRKKHHRGHRYAHRNRGHWEIEKIWIAPVYEKRWNPGHYNRRGEWVSGRYEKFVVQEGYWTTEKIWVRH